MNRHLTTCVITLGVCLAFATPGRAQVELRDHAGIVGTSVRQVSEIGVRIDAGGHDQLIGWDRVKRVRGDRAPDAAAFAQTSDHAWRARTRIERGDFAAAEPLLEALFPVYQNLTGPTASFVSEGLVSCRLARGAQTAAIVPWLACISADAGELRRDQWVGMQATVSSHVLDREYALCPSLPPVWVSGAALESLVQSPSWTTLTKAPGVPGQMARLYHQAARLHAEIETQPIDREFLQADSLGARLVLDMLVSWHGTPADRIAARNELIARLPAAASKGSRPTPRWVEAWVRFAVGRSMLREEDDHTRLLGVIQLLHVPVRFAQEQPYLAGMALGDCIAALTELRDTDGAGTLKHELATKLPRHPVLEWDRVRSVERKLPAQQQEE